jgi:hypothetical protein
LSEAIILDGIRNSALLGSTVKGVSQHLEGTAVLGLSGGFLIFWKRK